MSTHVYRPDYYDAITAGSLRSARVVLPMVFDAVRPESLLDVGSGIGAWSAVASELGVSDLVALDGDYVNREQLMISPDQFAAVNLEQPFDAGRRFDLVITLEVAEHLPEPGAASFVDCLTRHSDVVLFSAAIPRQGGENHLNEQWPEYWAALFAQHGYVAVDYVRPKVWHDPEVELWYAQNMLLFVRAHRLADFPALTDSVCAAGTPLSLVHPKLYDLYRPWSEQPYGNPFNGSLVVPEVDVPAAAAAPASPHLDLVVYSKDRAAQLELLLRSAKRFFDGWRQVNWTVMYTASTDDFARGYDHVRAEHPEFNYVDEREHDESFKELTLDAVGHSPYVTFLVDDNVFKAPFALDTPEFRRFAGDREIAALSLRMCPRMWHCYPTDEVTPAPEFDEGRVWDWRSARGGWGYPMSLDFHVFRSDDLLPLLHEVEFFNPNSLEEVLSQRPLDAPKMICPAETPIVNLPVNRVQDTAVNRHAGAHEPEDLNAEFLAGRRLDLEPIAGVEQVSTHHEMTLSWEDDAAAPEEQEDQAARSFVTVVHADEVLSSPDLLAAYELYFGARDDATLAVYAPDADQSALEPVHHALVASGFAGADAPDARIIAASAEDGDAALPSRASVVLTDREPRPGFEWLPHFGANDGALVRRMAESSWGTTPAAPAAPVAAKVVAEPALTAAEAWSVLQDRVGAGALDAERHLYEHYVADVEAYQALPGAEALDPRDLNPQVHDRTPTTPYDQHYFFQDVWAANRIADVRPARHVDVGSRVDFVGFLTAITNVTFVDIRPLPVELDRFDSVAGSILDLPFDSQSLESVSCLHVAEHIGLGRYGDPLDPNGTRDAATELQRVVAPGGQVLFSLPVGRPRTCFNAHRVSDPQAIRDLFPELELVEFSGVDDRGEFRRHRSIAELTGVNYGCGMFRLVRPAA